MKGQRKAMDMTLEEMVATYERFAGAHKYCLGFLQNGKLYFIFRTLEGLRPYFKLDHESSARGGAAKVRIRMTATERKLLVLNGEATLIGEEADLSARKEYNRGDNFERIVMEKLTGEVWTKNSAPFTVAGDIQVNGEEIQVKLDSAELTNAKFLTKLLQAA